MRRQISRQRKHFRLFHQLRAASGDLPQHQTAKQHANAEAGSMTAWIDKERIGEGLDVT